MLCWFLALQNCYEIGAGLVKMIRGDSGDTGESTMESGDDAVDGSSKKTKGSIKELDSFNPPKNFREFAFYMSKLSPFLWPSGPDSWRLRLMMGGCLLCFVSSRIVNVLLPLQYKVVVDALGGAMINRTIEQLEGFSGNGTEVPSSWANIPFRELSLFILVRCLQGSVGIVNTIQMNLWIPVGQFTTRQISVKMFEHLHSLSLRFHLNRKTGEILRVQDRGVASVVSVLNSMYLNVIPCLVDIAISVTYFATQFDLYFGFIVFVSMTMYLYCTVVITEWRTSYRRRANALDNAMEAKAVDSLLNFETVKYFCAEDFEVNQYTKAIEEYQEAEYLSSLAYWVLSTAQNLVIQGGLLAGCILCAKRILVDHTMDLGDFVLYYTYVNQLYGPLNFFGNAYRVIQKNFVDMEKMLDLFRHEVEIKDAPNAKPLELKGGEVVFENVSFAYDARNPILKGISFKVPAGSTVALVGPSGGGKSTILRLVFRFYDVQQGRILIDGQDIREVTQKSLRKAIGVVPQDIALFNDTINYNINYGRPEAQQDEIVEAAAAGQIHDRILSFPDQYDTKVGERGLRLSGGEVKRVAIARTLLKRPQIILLDEATSALDNLTERQLQLSLRKLCAGRTTLVIAHRLSTVVDADCILVMKGGQIVERGTHEELIRAGERLKARGQTVEVDSLGDVVGDGEVASTSSSSSLSEAGAGTYYALWMRQLEDDLTEDVPTQVSESKANGKRKGGEVKKTK
ncbi:ATP-binding cassette sub- B member 6, mitochondrial [Blyttiomyces sp. JEL0837]|nr:ATP-binding cassette sub- B member 6, mitochondrial [Blyttiomyces sp. JEL0837]